MKKKCNILHVLAARGWGGGEHYVLELAANLHGERFNSYIAAPTSESNREKILAKLQPEHLFEFRIGPMVDIIAAAKMARIIKDKDINIIHVNNFPDAFLAVWARRISGRRVGIVMTRHLIRKGKTGWLYQYLYRQIDRMIFVSELGKNEFLSAGAKIGPDKVAVVHNGIPDAPQDPSLRSGGTVTIAFAGRLVEEKGLHVLLEALAGLTRYNFKLKLVGSGDEGYIAELKRNATRNGLAQRISFAGFTGDVNGALQEASIGVLPSIVREGFPISVLEYMRAGLAVVASNDGGQAECLTDGVDSILVPNGDRERLAAALETLLADPVKCGKMGAEARKAFLASLTYDKFMRKMTAIYDGLCG